MTRRTPVLFRIVDSFFRYRWFFIIAMVGVTGTAMSALILRGKTFDAIARTQVRVDDVARALGEPTANAYISPAQSNVNKFNDLINDDLPGGFLDTALSTAHLETPISLDPQVDDPRYQDLRKHLTANVLSDTMFSIELVWDNKAECEHIVKALQSKYIDETGADKAASDTAALIFLNNQIDSYDNRLKQAEDALIQYKQRNAGQTPDAQIANENQLQNMKAQLANLQITSNDGAAKVAALKARLATVPKQSILQETVKASKYQDMISDLQAEIQLALAKYQPNHPHILDLKNQLANLEQEYHDSLARHDSLSQAQKQQTFTDNQEYQQLETDITNAEIDQQAQSSQIHNLESQIASYEALVAKIPEQEKELTEKTRQYNIVKEEYDKLLTQREEMKQKTGLEIATATSTLDPIGNVFAEPTTTTGKLILLIIGSIILGLIVGVLVLVLCEWSDTSLRYEIDTEQLLGVPVLAVVPESRDLRYLLPGPTSRKPLPEPAPAALPSPT